MLIGGETQQMLEDIWIKNEMISYPKQSCSADFIRNYVFFFKSMSIKYHLTSFF